MPTAIPSYTSKFKQATACFLVFFNFFVDIFDFLYSSQHSAVQYMLVLRSRSTLLRAGSSESAEKSVNFMHQMALTQHKQTVLPDLEQNYNKKQFLKKIMTLFGKKRTLKSENGFPRTFLTKRKGNKVRKNYFSEKMYHVWICSQP